MAFPELANVWAQNSSITLYGISPFFFNDREFMTAVDRCETYTRARYRGETIRIPESIWNIMTVEKTDKKNPDFLGENFTIYGASLKDIIADFDRRTIEGVVGLEKMDVQVTMDTHEFAPGGYALLHRLADASSRWSTDGWRKYGKEFSMGETYRDLSSTLKSNGVDLGKEPVDLRLLVMGLENRVWHMILELPAVDIEPIPKPKKPGSLSR